MKRIIIFVITIVLTALALFTIINFYPKEVNINAQGIKYRLGTELVESEKLIQVQIEGKLHKSFNGERKFEGTINIEGEEIPVPLDQRKLTILFADDGWGVITYTLYKFKYNGAIQSVDHFQYGQLVINNDFTKATIFVDDQSEIVDGNGSGWNSNNGQMITVPASSRTEAIQLTNEIAEKFLRGLILK